MRTPGSVGRPGKWPSKNGSSPRRCQTPLAHAPGVTDVTSETRRKGGRCGRTSAGSNGGVGATRASPTSAPRVLAGSERACEHGRNLPLGARAGPPRQPSDGGRQLGSCDARGSDIVIGAPRGAEPRGPRPVRTERVARRRPLRAVPRRPDERRRRAGRSSSATTSERHGRSPRPRRPASAAAPAEPTPEEARPAPGRGSADRQEHGRRASRSRRRPASARCRRGCSRSTAPLLNEHLASVERREGLLHAPDRLRDPAGARAGPCAQRHLRRRRRRQGTPGVIHHAHVGLGLAVDVERKPTGRGRSWSP